MTPRRTGPADDGDDRPRGKCGYCGRNVTWSVTPMGRRYCPACDKIPTDDQRHGDGPVPNVTMPSG